MRLDPISLYDYEVRAQTKNSPRLLGLYRRWLQGRTDDPAQSLGL